MGHLLANISIENLSNFYVYGAKQSDLMIFNNGQWKQMPKETLSLFIKRLIRNTIIKLGKRKLLHFK